MAKKSLGGSMDDLFGKRGPISPADENENSPENIVDDGKSINKRTGKKKVIPDNYQKTNYIIDPQIIKKFKAIAVLRGESVNILANEVLGKYVEENFNL